MSRTMLVFPSLPQTPVFQGEQEESKKTASTATSSGRAGARAHAYARGETEKPRASSTMDKLEQYYCATFGRRNCAPTIRRQISEALKAGMTAKTVAMCMDAAAEADSPSWAYAAAVIRGCIADGALTPEGFEARSARFRSRRKSCGKVPSAMNFLQRQYTPEEVEQIEQWHRQQLDVYIEQDDLDP